MARGIARTARRCTVVLAGVALVVVGLPPLVDVVAPRSATTPRPSAPVTDEPRSTPAAVDAGVDPDRDDPEDSAADGGSERLDRDVTGTSPGAGDTSEPDQPVRDADMPRLSEPIAFERGVPAPLGRVVIPSIGVDARFAEGVHDAVLTGGPGHWPGTPLPTQPGNSVLSGHRTTFTAPFGDLDLLSPGDEIRTSVGPHPSTTYRVTGIDVVPEAEYVDRVLRQPDDPASSVLTLFACHPKGSRTHRIVVTAQA